MSTKLFHTINNNIKNNLFIVIIILLLLFIIVNLYLFYKPKDNINCHFNNISGPLKKNIIDSIYFTVNTITTTGYGDIIPTSTFSKIWVSFMQLSTMYLTLHLFNL